jgi:2-octaprenyl-6-methoxyphenol hydroxylase
MRAEATAVHDLAIIGGGPVGMAAALASHTQGIKALLLEAQAGTGTRDPRVFALSYGARLILERLGAWAHIRSAHPIRVVHVSQRSGFGHAVLHAEELGVDALGYVVAQPALLQALRYRMAEAGVECLDGARVLDVEERPDMAVLRFEYNGAEQEACALIVAHADGGAALARETPRTEREYGQCALVAEVQCEHAMVDSAYERFTPRGPIALLPLDGGHALIWTVPETDAGALLALDDRQFERALAECYGERIGVVRLCGPRASFRLALRYAHRVAGNRHVLIGNAAQTLHPVAGQGFNLGLRDAYELASSLGHCFRRGENVLNGLREYRSHRRLDRVGGMLFTDFLVRAFSNDYPVLSALRGSGLALLDACSPAKKFLMRRMIFGASI